MVVALRRTRPPQGSHERERFASGQDVNVVTVGPKRGQEKSEGTHGPLSSSGGARLPRIFDARTSENPGSSAISAAVAARTPWRLPNALKSAR